MPCLSLTFDYLQGDYDPSLTYFLEAQRDKTDRELLEKLHFAPWVDVSLQFSISTDLCDTRSLVPRPNTIGTSLKL